MSFDPTYQHSHGPVICGTCDSIIQKCVCLPLGQEEEIVTCVKCKDRKSYEQQQRMFEANDKLRKLGIIK